MTTNKTLGEKKEWVFVPVHKTRVLKALERCYIIKCTKDTSTILPAVFKRAKETDEYIYFSLPSNFKINARISKKVDGKWEYEDQLFDLNAFDKYVFLLDNLKFPNDN